MAYRRKGGSALMALAKRRKAKAAKDKEGKLAPMVVKPTLSRLRTGAVTKRKRGGQTLKEMSEAGGKRRRDAKAKRVGGRKYVTPLPKRKSPATKAQTPKRKIPAGARSFRKASPRKASPKKSDVPPKFPAKGGRGRPPVHKALINYVKENPVETAAELAALHPIGRGVKWGATLAKGAHKAYKLRKAEKLRKANNARKARERREKLKGKKTEDAYKQFEKDRKERSRKMGRR